MPKMTVGSRVRISKQGLKNTGKFGTVVAIPADRPHIREVQLDDMQKGKTLKLKVESITELKLKKELVMPQLPKFVLLGDHRNPEIHTFRPIANKIEVRDDGRYRLHLLTEDKTVKAEEILGFICRNTQVMFKKPANVDEFPFWIWDDAVRGDLINGVTDDAGSKILHGRQANYRLSWLDIDSCKPQYKDVIEIPKQPIAPPKDELEQAYRLTEKQSEKLQGSGLCFGIVYRNKNNELKLVKRERAACHYGMKTMSGALKGEDDERDCTPAYGVQFITKKYYGATDDYNATIDQYLTWVMNDSPWSQYIITKDLKVAKKRGILIRLDIPDNAMMCTFYALRYPTEYTAKIIAWKKWVDLGMVGAGAFYAAETGDFLADTAGHHQLLDTHKMNLDDLKNFINHGVGRVLRDKYTQTWSYGDVSAHHGSRRDGAYAESAMKELQEMPDLFTVEKGGPMARDKYVVKEAQMVAIINGFKE